MTETPTFSQKTPEQPNNDSFDDILAMQELEMRRSAQRIIDETLAEAPEQQPVVDERQMPLPFEQPTQQAPEASNKARSAAIKFGAGAALVAGAAGIGVAASEATAAPEFTEETTTYVVEPGDGLYDAAEAIQGSFDMRDAVDHIENLPENAVTLEDGLQPGETISIPISTEEFEEKN